MKSENLVVCHFGHILYFTVYVYQVQVYVDIVADTSSCEIPIFHDL